MKIKSKTAFIIITIVFVILGSLSYGYNLLGICGTCSYTHSFTMLNQGVYSSMLGNSKIGFMHNYGLQTRFENIDGERDNPAFSAKDHTCNPNVQTQLRLYLGNQDVEDADTRMVYKSKVNLGAILSSIVDRGLSAVSVPKKLIWLALHGLSTLLALSLFVLCAYWCFKEFGILSAVLLYLLSLFSYWMIPYGSGLSNSLFAYLLPFVASLMLLYYEKIKNSQVKARAHFALAFLTITFKAMMGFEGIPTIMISLTIPYFYFAVMSKWSFKKFILRIVNVSLACVTGIGATVGVLFIQLKMFFSSTSKALDYIGYSFGKRAWDATVQTDNDYLQKSMDANLTDVFTKYTDLLKTNFIGKLSYYSILAPVLLIVIFLIVGLIVSRRKSDFVKKNKTTMMLIGCIALSIIASIATLVVLKSHSFVHTNFSIILFYIPLIVYLAALYGNVLHQLINWRDDV